MDRSFMKIDHGFQVIIVHPASTRAAPSFVNRGSFLPCSHLMHTRSPDEKATTKKRKLKPAIMQATGEISQANATTSYDERIWSSSYRDAAVPASIVFDTCRGAMSHPYEVELMRERQESM
jgi:hypothetical protein